MLSLHGILLVFILLISAASAQEYSDQPPEITKFIVNDNVIEKPDTFVKVLHNGWYGHFIKCLTKNGQTKKFQYRKNENDSWADPLPTWCNVTFNKESIGISNKEISRSSTDPQPNLKWNGFYRCHISVSVNGKTYVTISPTVRIIMPGVSKEPIAPSTPSPKPYQWTSYTIPCVRNTSTGLLPDYNDVIRYATTCPGSKPNCRPFYKPITYIWSGLTPATKQLNVDYETHIANSKGRIRKNPRTGDLMFAYLELSDQIPTGNDSYNRLNRLNNYHLKCEVDLLDSDSFTNNIKNFDILPSQSQAPEYTYMVPRVKDNSTDSAEAADIQECVEGQICEVVCMFGGKVGVSGKVKGRAPIKGDNKNTPLNETETGFTFKPNATGQIDNWKCELQIDSTNRLVATVTIQIKILNYAYLTDPASFPSVKYLPAGSQNVQFKCGASFARSTTFFINGSKLRDGDNNGIILKSDTLTYKSPLSLSHTASILCEIKASAGISYYTSTLVVHEPFKFTQSPEGTTSVREAINNATQSTLIFKCSAKFDSRVTEATMYWIYQKPDSDKNDETVTVTEFKAVVHIGSTKHVRGSADINSTLKIVYTIDSDEEIRGSRWVCALRYKFPDTNESLIITAPEPVFVSVRETSGNLLLLIVIIGGIVLLVLINFAVLLSKNWRKNRVRPDAKKKRRQKGANPSNVQQPVSRTGLTAVPSSQRNVSPRMDGSPLNRTMSRQLNR